MSSEPKLCYRSNAAPPTTPSRTTVKAVVDPTISRPAPAVVLVAVAELMDDALEELDMDVVACALVLEAEATDETESEAMALEGSSDAAGSVAAAVETVFRNVQSDEGLAICADGVTA